MASFPLPDAGFVNDVVLTRRAAYFTDSQVQQLYRVAIGRRRPIGEPTRIPITGDLQYTPASTPTASRRSRGGRTLIVVQSSTGKLFAVTPRPATAARSRSTRR